MAAELDPSELKQACDIKDLNLIQIVGKALEDQELNRSALNSLYEVIINGKQSQSKEAIK